MAVLARFLGQPCRLLAAFLLSPPLLAAQAGVHTVEGAARRGYSFTSRPHVSLGVYCGFKGANDPQVLVFRKSVEGAEWLRVGECSASGGRGSNHLIIADATTHFIVVLPKGAAPPTGGGWQGTSTVTGEAANDCGIRLAYADSSGNLVRVVLLDQAMAFGHGVPITPVCDPLLDHYDHFQE